MKHKSHFERGIFHCWRKWCQLMAAVHVGTAHIVSQSSRRCVGMVLSTWSATTKKRLVRETQFLLRVDNFQKRRRHGLNTATLIACWHNAVVYMRRTALEVYLLKVLACWQLYTQEQTLLRKYLNECSLAGFRGVKNNGSVPSPGSVQPADFENLYHQMAAQRWAVVDLVSD